MLLAVALFDVYPLRFVGVAEITRKVRNSYIKSLCDLQIMIQIDHKSILYFFPLDIWERYNRCDDYRRNAFNYASEQSAQTIQLGEITKRGKNKDAECVR